MWTTKFDRLLEMCTVQYVKTETFYVSISKISSFSEYEKSKANRHAFIILFMQQKLTLTFSSGDGTYCLAKETSPRKGIFASFFEKFFPAFKIYHNRTWLDVAPNHSACGKNLLGSHWLKKWATFFTFISILTLLICFQITWSSQYPMRESRTFLILVLIQLFYL